MKGVVGILICFWALWGCTYSGFDADEWDGGANQLTLELSEATISLDSYNELVDTVTVSTNGESWDFESDNSSQWCRGFKKDSLLILFVEKNFKSVPRLATFWITSCFSDKSITKELKLLQPANNELPDTGETIDKWANPDYVQCFDCEWTPVGSIVYNFNIDETLKRQIYSKLGIDESENLTQAVLDRRVFIKAYSIDKTLTKNLLNNNTIENGFRFTAAGLVAGTEEKGLSWNFIEGESGVDYTRSKVTLDMNIEDINATYYGCYVFTTSAGKSFTLIVVINVSKSLPAQCITVGYYDNLEFEVEYDGDDCSLLDSCLSIEKYSSKIENLLGGAPDRIYISNGVIDGDFNWIDGQNNGWFVGLNGAAQDDSTQFVLCLRPVFGKGFEITRMSDPNKFPSQYGNVHLLRVRYYLVNTSTMRGVELNIKIKVKPYGYKEELNLYLGHHDIYYYTEFPDGYCDLSWHLGRSPILKKALWSLDSADEILVGESLDYPCLFRKPVNGGGNIWFGVDGDVGYYTDKSLCNIRFDSTGHVMDARFHPDFANRVNSPIEFEAGVILRFINNKRGLMSDVKLVLRISVS